MRNIDGRRLLAILVLALFGACPAAAKTFAVKISAQPLSQALAQLALQTELSIGETGINFGHVLGNPVYGNYSPHDALTNLLAGTGFSFDTLDDSTVRIRILGSLPSAPPLGAGGTEIVVVTATKRKEIARQVPNALKVVLGQQLADERVATVQDLARQVAELTTTNLGPGQDKIFLRGLTDSVLPGLSESMLGVYLDESRIGNDTPDPDLRLVDVERLEIMNGPQGTLYGAGTLGGLVRIVTHQPDMDILETAVSGELRETEEGGVSNDVNAMINVPLVADVLALRAVGYESRDGGYIDETRLGVHNANRTLTQGGRASLKWDADDTWSATIGFAYQDIAADDSQYLDVGDRNFQRDSYILEPQSNRLLAATLTATADFGWATLISSSAFVDRHLSNRFDASLSWEALTGFPIGPSTFDYARRIRDYTHETRLVSALDGRWKWLAGLFMSLKEEGLESSLAGPDNSGAPIVARGETRKDRGTETALFGEVNFAATEQISFTAGLRVFLATKATKAHVASILESQGDTSFQGFNRALGKIPKVVVSYRSSSDVMLYGQISGGYRLGGLNADGPPEDQGGDIAFDPDTLWNFEIGSKARFFDGALLADVAAYFDRWSNVQTDQIGSDGSLFILNAGTAKNLGAEASLTVHPAANVTITGNILWDSPAFSRGNPLLIRSEGALPGAPRIKFGVEARYDVALGEAAGFAAIGYSYIGRSHLGFDADSPQMGDYGLINLRTGLARSDWSAYLFIDNLTGVEANTFSFGNPFDPHSQMTPPRPRTIGLSVAWRS